MKKIMFLIIRHWFEIQGFKFIERKAVLLIAAKK